MDPYVVRLNCDHTVSLTVCPIESMWWCTRCQHDEFIIQRNAMFRWKCVTCHSGRSYGAAQLDMQRGATKHAMKYLTHIIHEIQGEDVVLRVRVPSRSQEYLELDLDAPPF